MNRLAEMFQSQLFGTNDRRVAAENGDFVPDIDIFDTTSAYIIHASLPGAKKSDISVSWAAEKSSLILSGVVHRPGDEELLSALALDERKVGAFEREIKLGGQTNPTLIDEAGIKAKLEDGILRIEVPKYEQDDFVEIKKVDIE